MDLSVRDLGDWSSSWDLDLSVRDLSDGFWYNGSGLDLAVRDLRDWLGASCGGLWLSVGDLRDRLGSGGSDLWLSVRDLRDTSRGRAGDDIEEDGLALSSPLAIVQVGESTSVARVEDSRGAKSERAVAQDREASSVDGTRLWWSIELELVVGCDVSSSLLGVGEDAVSKGDCEDTSLAAR